MLKRFSVENFKGFREKITLKLDTPCNYGFHQAVVSEGCITKGIIYGSNSSGKSNLGLALFDIICHLTDKQKITGSYDHYLNMDRRKSAAEFEYVFEFQGKELIYCYEKQDADTLWSEKLIISGREVVYYDHLKKEGFTLLAGSETLNNTIVNESPISRVKFVSSNAILTDNEENAVFMAFMDYVNRMLLFYSLDQRGYEGFKTGRGNIAQGIIESGKLADFQEFLGENGVIYNLLDGEIDGERAIYCHFERQDVNFFKIASTGTKSLALFYYWYIRMHEASFVYIDEFDAFYHFELSDNLIRKLREIQNVQIFTSTHNTDLMSNDLLRPDCYFILEDNKIVSIADSTDKELRKAHNLQKMYKAGAFNGR